MEQPSNKDNQQPDWFENFLSDYDYQSPKPGQVLDGAVIRMDEEGILVDVGLKRDALIPARDLSQVDESILASLEVGDIVTVYVLSQGAGDRDLMVSLSKGIEHQSWEKAEKYLQEGITVELEIIGYNRGGLIVKYETLRGFLPFSLVPEIHGVRSPRRAERIKNNLVGKQIELKIIEVARNRNRLIFSAAAAQEDKRRKRLEELERGQIITGQVVSIVDFGAFVDLDGVDGLVHISQLDWKKVKHPSEVVRVGEEIEVKVIDVDVERERVSLSRKSLLPSPWETIEETLKEGDYVEGRVTRIVDFGAFVALPIGIEGLVHISQIGYSSTQDPKTAIKPGETVLLRILEIHPERKRIALSMRQVPLEKQIAWAMEHLGEGDLPDRPDEPPISISKDEPVNLSITIPTTEEGIDREEREPPAPIESEIPTEEKASVSPPLMEESAESEPTTASDDSSEQAGTEPAEFLEEGIVENLGESDQATEI